MKVIYSNCLGSYAIEDKIADSILFDDADAVEKCLQLEKGNIIEEEKQLKQKYPDAKFLKELEPGKISEALSLFKEKSNEFFETELKLVRKKIRESVKFDNLLINASDSVEESIKCINMLSRRLREWFELENPEFSRKVQDNISFARKVTENPQKEKNSMGADIRPVDFEAIKNLAKQILELDKSRQEQENYIDNLMKENCPNIRAVAGSAIGAKLIALAGSFERLMKMPASTIQVLGAEKALFRHIRTGAKSPKHGVIAQQPVVMASKSKGAASRQLADKISIASRVDFFRGEFIGEKLLEGLKKKLGGKNGSKNLS